MIVGSEHLRFWCDMSMECIRRDHTSELSPGDQRGPFLTARALGMALAALHDAHAVASARPPLLGIVAHASAMAPNPELAASAACAQVLRLRYPNQANLLEVAWTHWLEYFGLYPASSPAGSPPTHSVEAAGRAHGTLMHRKGAADVANSASDQYMPTGAPYNHAAPANETTQGFAGGIWGNSMPLLATRVATFPGPPGRVSPARVDPTHHFAQDFAKVVAKGEDSRAACDRSLKEEVIGIAWGYDGAAQLGTPPRLYMQVVLNILDTIEARSPAALSVSDELELLAGIAIAMA